MSIWQLGSNELTPEAQTFKNKLSSKESQIAAQQNEILKQAQELAELKATLNDTLHKLNHETTRAVSLESTLAKCTEDLRNENLAAQNAAAALLGVQEKLRAKDLETRALESTLESLSHTSNSSNARGTKLEKEKTTLEARVRELEGNLRQLSSPAPTAATPSRHRTPSRRRSSSVSDTRITTLEQDLKDARTSLAQRDTELRTATAKLTQAQSGLVKVENEKVASDKRLHAEIRDLRVALQEKEEDLRYLRDQQGDGGREDELLKRIDEDDAKIAALEKLLALAPETKTLKEKLRRLEQKLVIESERAVEMDVRQVELVREKEEALDEREEAQARIAQLSEELRQHMKQVQQSAPHRPSVEEDMERLLGAVERVRRERDNLRLQLEFALAEAKFREEALEAQIAALASSPTQQPEVDLLRQQLTDARAHEQQTLHRKNLEIRRLGLTAMASTVVIEHLQSQAKMSEDSRETSPIPQDGGAASQRLKEVQLQLETAAQDLETMTRQRDELLAQGSSRESELFGELGTVQAAHQDAQDQLMQFDSRLNDLSRSLFDVETERNNLHLQVTNLTKDLEAAHQEIADAETRYSELQFHQLNSMTSNDAAQALRAQLAEQEARVLRRTELVGILQHDSKRLETNLKLQEERLSEMTTELEVMAAEKDAMVEDCADARQARDAAIARVEDLEVEMETLESRLEEGDAALCALVGVVVQTASHSRRAVRQVHVARADMAPAAVVESIDWPSRVAELDTKLAEMQAVVSTTEASHRAEIQRLTDHLIEKDSLIGANDLEGELASLKVKHVEEMGQLQGQLVETTSALDEARARCEAAEENYRQILADSATTKHELEAAAEEASSEAENLKSELARIKSEHVAAVERVQAEVAEAVSEAEKAHAAHRELEDIHEATVGELAQAADALRVRLRELEERVAELDSQLEAQTAQCDALGVEGDALRDQLSRESGMYAQEKQELEAALHRAREEYHNADSSATALAQQLEDVMAELTESRNEVDSLQRERTTLQEDVTTLQAEIQRSLSLKRYMENQIKESEQSADALNVQLEQVKAQHARVEKACKAAEVNLSLQNAQHKREMTELQRQLSAMHSQPDLTHALAELEERNNEMEELLKNKCAEIEENDDRALEMLKNNKKLTTKVESLTRKVQNLQAKLAAAKATASLPMEAPQPTPSPPLPGLPSARPRSNTLAGAAPTPSLPPSVPASPVRSNRVASGSAIPRPKTPERRAMPLVFRAQTPEKRTVPFPPSPSVPVLGQKRRAPDDFEDVHVPTQGFTPDCIPDENGTPRVRRVLNSLHSGFTPVRNAVARAAPTASPPKRSLPSARTSPYIADVTNSPRLGDTAKAKRTWLGKIRGTSSQPRGVS
ncbi:Wd40 containing snare-dependent exocytosis protein [Favolaschia claudopus]|uniref:Wd40 containing snare-dependent exocytosis protein n=1 Tax=Favolaschia claudopus TaxID=2862362 RepID=A0AAW0EEL4_9AGAR